MAKPACSFQFSEMKRVEVMLVEMQSRGLAAAAARRQLEPLPQDDGLTIEVSSLQDKCRHKDRIIEAMVHELQRRTNSGVFQRMFDEMNATGANAAPAVAPHDGPHSPPDYNRSRVAAALPRPQLTESACCRAATGASTRRALATATATTTTTTTTVTATLPTPAAKQQRPMDSVFGFLQRQVLRTPAEKPGALEPMPVETMAPRQAHPAPTTPPLTISEVRRLAPAGLLVKWEPTAAQPFKGYEVRGLLYSCCQWAGLTVTLSVIVADRAERRAEAASAFVEPHSRRAAPGGPFVEQQTRHLRHLDHRRTMPAARYPRLRPPLLLSRRPRLSYSSLNREPRTTKPRLIIITNLMDLCFVL